MTINVLVSSAAFSLTDHFSASEGLAAYHIMKGLGLHDVRFKAVAANVLIRNMPPNMATTEIRVPPDSALLGNRMLTLAAGTYYLARNYQTSLGMMRREDFDLVHHMFPSNNMNFSLLPLLSDVGRRCPFVFGPVCGPEPVETPYHRLFARLHDANCRKADAVIVQTKLLREMYAERFGDDKVTMIPLGIESEYLEPYEPTESGGFEVLTVANLREGKGLRYLVAAMADVVEEVKNAHLTIVGDGPERANLQAQIAALQLDRHIRLAGFVPREDLLEYYRRASVFCLPSMNEVFGKVLVEAMACGKPVVSTDGPGPRHIVEEGRTGLLVPPRDSPALAEALKALASDQKLRAAMSAAARERAGDYSWDVIVEKYWEVYRRLLEK
jgi:glycosyltransferase involved in cell wall biosynthesis